MFFTILEQISVILALIYISLMIKGKYIAWYFALISSGLITSVFLLKGIYFQALLNFIYVIVAVMGIFKWKNIKHFHISSIKIIWHIVIFIFSMLLVYFLFIGLMYYNAYNNYTIAFLDVFIFIMASLGSVFQVYKNIINWFYLFISNMGLLILCFIENLYYMFVLTSIYTILSVWGYLSWKKKK